MTQDDLKSVFESAGFAFSRETIACCFIFLLKKSGDLLYMRKSDLVSFIHNSAGKALDFSMTGSRFPMECELNYSSDSEEVNFPDEVAVKTEVKFEATVKSVDAVVDGKSLQQLQKSPGSANLQVQQYKSQEGPQTST